MAETKLSMDNMPFRKFHYKIAAYTIGGSLVDGYILGIIGIALAMVGPQMQMNSVWQGLIGSSALIGIFFGALIAGPLSDRIGRQRIYTIHFIILIVFSILQFYANSPGMLLFLRIVLGISMGAEYAIGPSLLAEFTPKKQRGVVLSILHISWAFGYLLAAVAGYYMKDLGPDAWRWLLCSQAIPAIIIMFFRAGAPESPRWLINNGQYDKAREIVHDYLGPDVDIEDLINNRKAAPAKLSFIHLFTKKVWKRTAFSCIFYTCQTMPYYAIFTFAPTVLLALQVKNAFAGTLLLNSFIVLGSIFGTLITNKITRRAFVIYGFAIQALTYLLLGTLVNPPNVVVLILFVIYSLIGSAAANLLFVYPAEIFPTNLRSTGSGVTIASSRIGSALGTFALPVLITSIGLHTSMIILACILALGAVVSIAWAPETGKKGLDEASEVQSNNLHTNSIA